MASYLLDCEKCRLACVVALLTAGLERSFTHSGISPHKRADGQQTQE
jgi:hypothetical protein